MGKTQLRAVDNQQPHDLDIARQRIAQFRLDRDKGFQPLPTTNQHDDRGGRRLDVVAVVHSGEPHHAPNVSEMRRRSLLRRLLRWR